MAENDFLVFAGSPGANVETQEQWATDLGNGGALEDGFQSGLAKSSQFNKALRQGTTAAAVLGQLIADATGQSALDNGDLPELLSRLSAAIHATAATQTVVWTSPGAVSWTVPAGVYSVEVDLWGGGGGGGGARNGGQSGGGGGAGYCRQRLAVTPGATIPGFVGAGGAGGPGTPAAGAPGEDTWFGSTSFLARGGPGGLAGNGSSGGPVPGGSAVGGDEAIAGQPGSGAFGAFGGSGGAAARGGAGAPTGSSGGTGGAGVAPGGGGGGTAAGAGQGYAGGAGAPGRIVIRY